MSIIGLDFGSHSASVALYYEDKDILEVIADDIGSRTIASCVAFRNDEILTGQTALAQMHKNSQNTFLDIRSFLLNSDEDSSVQIPCLEKSVTNIELGSHFFRNIHNQVKQQVGSVVRNCIITLPPGVDDQARARLIKSAQEGGLRIKTILSDPIAVMLAYRMDDRSYLSNRVVVVDMGYSKTEVAIFDIKCGVFYLIGNKVSTTACGKDMVRLVSEHCAKDFQRRAKFPCIDNSRAMMRLRRECETAIKSLSTGAEVTIDIDSLCEGVDYSGKLSRARFEDLCATTFMALRSVIQEALESVPGLQTADISHVLIAGGLTSIPKVQTTLKSIFPNAIMPSARSRMDPAEVVCTGAAQHARLLLKHKLLDEPAESLAATQIEILSKSIFAAPLTGTATEAAPLLLLSAGSLLPASHLSRLSVQVPPGCTKAALSIQAQGIESVSEFVTVAVLPLDVSQPPSETNDIRVIDILVETTVSLAKELTLSARNADEASTVRISGSVQIAAVS